MNRQLLTLATLVLASSSFAVYVSPTSPDGAGLDVQSQLIKLGIGSSLSEDQVDARLFLRSASGPMRIETLFGYAGYYDNHKVGFYSAGAPDTINWVAGGKNTGLSDNGDINFNGIYGLALQSPDGTFRSETARNADGFNHVAVLRERDKFGRLIQNSYILCWEDLRNGGDKDYNDRAFRLTNAQAVPEPATIAVLGLGAFSMIRRKRAKK
jgi:hypothetical protein